MTLPDVERKASLKASPIPFHPVFFALYPIVSLLATNAGQVGPAAGVRPAALALAAAAVTLATLTLVVRDIRRAAAITSLLLIAFFGYGHVYALLKHVEWMGGLLGRHRYLIPLGVAVLAAATVAILRARHRATLTVWLNALGVMAVALPLWQIATVEVRSRVSTGGEDPLAGAAAAHLPQPAPDVYYLVLDAYTRADILAADFGIDNTPFLDDLRRMGFFVADCAQSNYAQTELTLSTTLNLDYLENLGPDFRPGGRDRTPFLFLIRESRLRRFLESFGYRTVALETGYAWSEWQDADEYLRPEGSTGAASFHLTAFEALLADSTALSIFTDARAALPPSLGGALEGPLVLHRQRILFGLDQLGRMPTDPGPKFVFAHLVVPHRPYIFHPDLESRRADRSRMPDLDVGDRGGYYFGYRDQVLFLNDRMVPILEGLLRESATPPVIVLMGDHGADEAGPQERMANLLAVYLPGGTTEGLAATLTPVNAFRVVLDNVFGLDLPLLANRSLYSIYDAPFDFTSIPQTCPGG